MMDIEKLSWNLPEKVQKEHIELMNPDKDDDIEQLILPDNKQSCWENCAIVLSRLKNETFMRFLPKVLEWFKDLNWPGTEVIRCKILRLPKKCVQMEIYNAIKRAEDEGDEEWAENLYYTFIRPNNWWVHL